MTKLKPLFSIIIPTKNEAKYLPILLDCIKADNFSDYELIVADSHSTDKTREIARSYGCKVVDGGMPGVGRNKGEKVAKGQFLLFFDADIRFKQGFLTKLHKKVAADTFDIASGITLADSKHPLDVIFLCIASGYLYALQKVDPHMFGCYMVISRKLFKKIGGFNEKLHLAEDHDLARRGAKMGRFAFLTSPRMFVSVRRFIKEGRLNLVKKILYVEFYMFFKNKEVIDEIVEYNND
jgi:glycosyltransferase involved in cell wall biosynthesis